MKYFFIGFLIVIFPFFILLHYTENIYESKSIFSISSLYNSYLYSNSNPIFFQKQNYIKFEKIPSDLMLLVMWSEDRDFFKHPGINFKGIIRAFIENLKFKDISQGGSSITQQLVKNIYLSNEKTLKRKIIEAFISLWVERSYNKEEILEAYMNTVYLGNGITGFGAASKRYFGKDIENLDFEEKLILVGIINAPERFNPYKYPKKAKEQAQILLNSLDEDVFNINKKQIKEKIENLKFIKFEPSKFEVNLIMKIKDELNKIGIKGGGFTVKTTLDENLIKSLKDTFDSSTCAIVIDNKTGKILGFWGNVYDVFYSRLQIGSTIKPFYYALAIEKGLNVDDYIPDKKIKFGDWEPKNFDKKYRGKVKVKEALIESINIPSIHVGMSLASNPLDSIKIISNFLKNEIGLKGVYPEDLTLLLGTIESNVFQISQAFTIFPNYGLIPQPYLIEEIYDRKGNLIYKHYPRIKKKVTSLSIKTYSIMNDLLKEVVKKGTAKYAYMSSFDLHGKTGTSNQAVWFTGYDNNLVFSVKKTGKDLLSTTHVVPIARKIEKNLNDLYGSKKVYTIKLGKTQKVSMIKSELNKFGMYIIDLLPLEEKYIKFPTNIYMQDYIPTK